MRIRPTEKSLCFSTFFNRAFEPSIIIFRAPSSLHLLSSTPLSTWPSKVVRFLTLPLFWVRLQALTSFKRAFEPSLLVERAFEPSFLFERAFEPSHFLKRAFEPPLPFERAFEPSHFLKHACEPSLPVECAFESSFPFERAFEPSHFLKHACEPSLLVECAFESSFPFERAFEPSHFLKHTCEPSLPFERAFEPSFSFFFFYLGRSPITMRPFHLYLSKKKQFPRFILHRAGRLEQLDHSRNPFRVLLFLSGRSPGTIWPLAKPFSRFILPIGQVALNN